VRRPPSRAYIWLGGLLAGLASACATTTKPPPSVVPPVTPASAPVRLAWLPVETRDSATLAGALNERLARVPVEGVAKTFRAPVSMEMAQLAIECIEPTPRCYAAVGRSVGADRLLWAEVDRGARGAVTVRVSLFDAGAGAIVKKAEHAYPTAAAARAGVGALLEGAFSGLAVAKREALPVAGNGALPVAKNGAP
jgi:hypothetical protein